MEATPRVALPVATFIPSEHQMVYVPSCICSIKNEQWLRLFEHETVECSPKACRGRIKEDLLLRERFCLPGTVAVESHTNLAITDDFPET